MKRFLSTTAVLIAMSGAAYADTNAHGFGTVTFEESDFYASDLIGMRIYNSENEYDPAARVPAGTDQEWDDIGEINDIILSESGEVRAVILGIGGFLGLGERDVSVSMDAIQVLHEGTEDGERFLVVNTSKEVLEQAPEFERAMDEETDTAATETAEDRMEETAAVDTPRAPLTRPAVERDGYQEVDMEKVYTLTAEDLTGAYVYGANDETVGEIDNLIMSDDGNVSEVIVNVGGFLGMGEKPVAVTFEELQVLQNPDSDSLRIYIDSTQESLEQLPEYES